MHLPLPIAPLILMLSLGVACAPPTTNDDLSAPQQQAMLDHVARNIIAPLTQRFAQSATELHQATGPYAQSPTDDALHQTARQAWRDTMSVWQRLEVLQVGPAGSSVTVTAGENLRDEVYSWPSTNPCRVDQETLKAEHDQDDFFTTRLGNAYGLDAMEYLLFAPDDANQCASLATINQGPWQALLTAEVSAGRAAYAHNLATELLSLSKELADAWTPDTGAFFTTFVSAGTSDSSFQRVHHATNELYHALFYAELKVKDAKLGVPTGHGDCDAPLCADRRESRWANASTEHIIANLETFETVFTGGDQGAPGFDDLLATEGAEDIATAILGGVTRTLEALRSLEVPLHEALTSNLETLERAYTELQRAMTRFKTDFADVLQLEVPKEGAGDND